MNMIKLNPDILAAPFGNYSHGVEIQDINRIVRTSGQLSMGVDGDIPQTAYEQAQMIFQNLDEILKSGHMSVGNIVHLGAYVTDRSYMADYMKARDEFLGPLDVPPASTLLIVSGFTKPEFKVEVEITAMD